MQTPTPSSVSLAPPSIVLSPHEKRPRESSPSRTQSQRCQQGRCECQGIDRATRQKIEHLESENNRLKTRVNKLVDIVRTLKQRTTSTYKLSMILPPDMSIPCNFTDTPFSFPHHLTTTANKLIELQVESRKKASIRLRLLKNGRPLSDVSRFATARFELRLLYASCTEVNMNDIDVDARFPFSSGACPVTTLDSSGELSWSVNILAHSRKTRPVGKLFRLAVACTTEHAEAYDLKRFTSPPFRVITRKTVSALA
jgi:hypothetical protein